MLAGDFAQTNLGVPQLGSLPGLIVYTCRPDQLAGDNDRMIPKFKRRYINPPASYTNFHNSPDLCFPFFDYAETKKGEQPACMIKQLDQILHQNMTSECTSHR